VPLARALHPGLEEKTSCCWTTLTWKTRIPFLSDDDDIDDDVRLEFWGIAKDIFALLKI
jgi:hypothetical protein